MTEARTVTAQAREDDRSLEQTLRPRRLTDDEYIDQRKVKDQLRILIEAARRRSETLEHVALYGP
ncbi:MAG TPA: Holliday junction branch migration DNA helicase RuvB, partial [Candidatus Limnocylindria bacterium]